ncbi:probable ATP-dependent RNA helicase DHX58 isoform X1 [Apteryx rowi]|uniref:probable ATP-dependent RNA helicase DHX58 isoform X1 n=1 Tax=Apteryx rowi TaxID=308060 RepID=UPI000E1D379E|nr:probable ATP-dependent RNA helicase DHX58 isoform X1 [Apteryx rowi]
MELRDYQWEVITPALGGENSIIWLPTGAGKTRAAVYVCKRHLETRQRGKVAVLVNKVHLVDQHAKKEFHVLQDAFRITAISGDNEQKFFFAWVVKQNDIVICTAQILQNALVSKEEDMHVELTDLLPRPGTDFSLLVIDECHHTQKDAIYNKIMLNYLQHKLRGRQNLPQILGLTASPGTGGATSFEGAVEHILQICANLDTAKIMSAQEHLHHLQTQVPQPRKQYNLCQERAQDPFGEQLKKIMDQIQQYMGSPGLPQDFGTQIYEQRIVELEKNAAETFCRKRRVCALHLRKYNDALLINDTVRMIDAFQCLREFYLLERDMKDPTERFLATTFEENRMCLLELARNQQYENPRLSKLEEILQEQFQSLGTSRGIVFTRTRQSAHSLRSWLKDTASLRGLDIRAAVLTGAGYSNQTKHMTQNEQQDVIELFRKGDLNLLFSTSVAEEGLDIPECNIVVRYGLMTNEIAMMQARGRARAENSVYSILAKASSREVSRELLNEDLIELMVRAIRKVQDMPEREYRLKITELQRNAVVSWKLKEAKNSERRQLHDPGTACLYCVNCNMAVCHGSDIRTVEGMHHVNINPLFRLYYRVTPGKVELERSFKDWEPGCRIVCNECSQDWGMEMIYQGVKLPILCIKNFVVETPAEKRKYKKWSSVTFSVKEFDYLEYCSSIEDQPF